MRRPSATYISATPPTLDTVAPKLHSHIMSKAIREKKARMVKTVLGSRYYGAFDPPYDPRLTTEELVDMSKSATKCVHHLITDHPAFEFAMDDAAGSIYYDDVTVVKWYYDQKIEVRQENHPSLNEMEMHELAQQTGVEVLAIGSILPTELGGENYLDVVVAREIDNSYIGCSVVPMGNVIVDSSATNYHDLSLIGEKCTLTRQQIVSRYESLFEANPQMYEVLDKHAEPNKKQAVTLTECSARIEVDRRIHTVRAIAVGEGYDFMHVEDVGKILYVPVQLDNIPKHHGRQVLGEQDRDAAAGDNGPDAQHPGERSEKFQPDHGGERAGEQCRYGHGPVQRERRDSVFGAGQQDRLHRPALRGSQHTAFDRMAGEPRLWHCGQCRGVQPAVGADVGLRGHGKGRGQHQPDHLRCVSVQPDAGAGGSTSATTWRIRHRYHKTVYDDDEQRFVSYDFSEYPAEMKFVPANGFGRGHSSRDIVSLERMLELAMGVLELGLTDREQIANIIEHLCKATNMPYTEFFQFKTDEEMAELAAQNEQTDPMVEVEGARVENEMRQTELSIGKAEADVQLKAQELELKASREMRAERDSELKHEKELFDQWLDKERLEKDLARYGKSK